MEKNEKVRVKACASATSSTTNPTWTDPVANTGFRSERLANNHLNNGSALILSHLEMHVRRSKNMFICVSEQCGTR
jgi:hypothetical protein